MVFADIETQKTLNKNDFKHVKDRSTPPTIFVTGASIFLIEEKALRGIGQMFIDFIDKMRETEPDYMAELAKLADEIAAKSDTKMKADAEVEAKRNPRKKKGSKS